MGLFLYEIVPSKRESLNYEYSLKRDFTLFINTTITIVFLFIQIQKKRPFHHGAVSFVKTNLKFIL